MPKLTDNPWVRLAMFVAIVPAVLLAMFVSLWAVYATRDILVPFTLALIAAYIFDPVVDFIERRLRVPRSVAVILLCVTAVLALIIGAAWALPQIIRGISDAAEALSSAKQTIAKALAGENQEIESKLEEFLGSLPARVQTSMRDAADALAGKVQQHVSEILSSLASGAYAFLRAVLSVVLSVFSFVLFFVVTAYLLQDFDAVKKIIVDLIPRRHKHTFLRLTREIDTHLRAFFRGQILVSLCLGGIYGVGLQFVARVPYGFFIGMAAGLANMVPYLGLAVGLLPAMLLAYIQWGNCWNPILAALVFAIGQIIEGMYLTPKIIGESIGLNPVAIILSIMVCGRFLGFLGILFAVPIAAITKVLLHDLIVRYKSSELYTGTTTPEPPPT